MLLGFGVSILLGHAKVHYMDHIGSFGVGPANQEVVGFDITVDEVFFVYGLHSGKLHACQSSSRGRMGSAYHLLGDHDHGFDRKPSVAMIEEVFQARSQKVDDEDVVQTFLTEVVHIGNASCGMVSANKSHGAVRSVHLRQPTKIL